MPEKMSDTATELFVIIGKLVVGMIGIAGVSLLFALPVMWCWNALIPYMFGLPVITWGKAWCLQFLCGMLLKSKIK